MTIKATPTADGKRIEIRFPYDPAFVGLVKTIPGAKWSPSGFWTVAKQYQKRVEALGKVGEEADAAFSELLSSKKGEIHRACSGLIDVYVKPKARLVEISTTCGVWLGPIGELPDARSQTTNRKFTGYHVTISTEERIDRLIAALAQAVADHKEKVAGAGERRAARDAEEAAERAAKRKADAEAGRGRTMVLVDRAPAVGTVVREGDGAVRITSFGKAWRLGDDSSAYGISPSWEGEKVCYAYFDRATAAEAAALVAREEKEATARSVVGARSKAVAKIAASKDRPEIGSEPAGETIWTDDSVAISGWRQWVVLTPDGWLWLLTYAGGDSDTWGDRNCGYCTAGSRIAATAELISAIRGEGREVQ